MVWFRISGLLPMLFTAICAKSDYSVIDLSDILNKDYMPRNLLVLESPEEKEQFKNETAVPELPLRGTFEDALATMGFHRKMMNEYLCRTFLSEQIIEEMKSTRVRRRLGSPAEKEDTTNTLATKINLSLKNNMLEDEGSSNYRDWLKKSATLEDIYRHYETAESRESTEPIREDEEEVNEEYDSNVTGYGYEPPKTGPPSKLGHSETGGGYAYHGFSGGSLHSGIGSGLHSAHGHSAYGGGGGGSYYAGHGHSDHVMLSGGHGHSQGGYEHTPKHSGGSGDKDKLADLFDIALTALAYLSFGMFMIQVVMCISAAKATTMPTTTTTMAAVAGMMDMTGEGGAGAAEGADGGAENLDNFIELYGLRQTEVGSWNRLVGQGRLGGSAFRNTVRGQSHLKADRFSQGSEDGEGGFAVHGEDEEAVEDVSGDGVDGDGFTSTADGFTTDASVLDTGTGTGTGSGTGATALSDGGFTYVRVRRDIPTLSQPDDEAINELARRVLISIEAAMVANQDDGTCLRKVLCDNNAFSRNLESSQKYWIPVWSLGMSWLSGRLVSNLPRATTMLDSLKAALLGLGNADCELLYHDCELGKQRQRRRRRRRAAN